MSLSGNQLFVIFLHPAKSSTPSQRDAVVRLMQEQRPVIAGPLELAQGGVGIINRIPIVFTQPDGASRYWGLASVAINPLPIFEHAGIRSDAAPHGMRYALRGKDGRGAQGEVFLGEPELFDDPDAVLMDVIIPGGSWRLAVHMLKPVGGYGIWVQALLLGLAALAGALVAFSLAAHRRIRCMGLHDNLTGLANRHQFSLRGQDLFSLAKRSHRPLTLLNIDINDFKSVNDSYGHAAGDAVLVQVANGDVGRDRHARIRKRIRNGETLRDVAPAATQCRTAVEFPFLMKTVSARELASWLADDLRERPLLLEVREPWEMQICRIDGSEPMPMRTVPARARELERTAEVVCVCHHGRRSMHVGMFLEQQGFTNVYNLTGGVDAWARQVDTAMPIY